MVLTFASLREISCALVVAQPLCALPRLFRLLVALCPWPTKLKGEMGRCLLCVRIPVTDSAPLLPLISRPDSIPQVIGEVVSTASSQEQS
jgi:hypothetical protein